ncbi:branched-chain amino acid ABC transporter permease [Nocardioides sp. WL0053]|jgi:branched-chain amino acid transport system permease protein|uniref:Branched-chain amino acid ABC transporter permease n=1 Tax=Nocardioides jiangsuensis TaxID=2866161 RepID=A0ABS7RIJ9_9ACTN|nr:branched-chain amino acid ABC transporter permease [Nocardioides jiangsuensis]MBY9073645.1 branched-chain amino acid ABC transporter permease [Nocardioides jiangsuensis]
MQTGIRRIAGLLLAVVVAVLALSGTAQAAAAAAPTAADAPACVLPEITDDDTISILGRICDTRETPQTPVEGVDITVEDESGNVVGEATTTAEGTFEIPLPGTTVDNLGKTFTVKVDEKSMPEGAALRNPDDVTRDVQINLDNDVSVSFPVGEAAGGEGIATQGLQLLVGGIVFSTLLAMAALGLSMIFGTTGLTNFAHGELITFGALVAYAVDQLPGAIRIGGTDVTVVVAVIVSFILSGVFGYLNDKALWKPLRMRGTGVIAMMIVSIGLSIFLRNIFQYVAGGQNHNYSQYAAVQPWEIGPILLTPKDTAVALLGVAVLIAVSLLLQYTRIGKATRAVADNPALASSSGINVERVIAVVWTGGAALAGLSGVLLGLTQGFDYQLGFKILLLVFAAVVLGGLGTIWGAMLGAFIIGIFIEVSTLFIPSELKFVGALVVLIVVLLIRPQGLLGKAQRVG